MFVCEFCACACAHLRPQGQTAYRYRMYEYAVKSFPCMRMRCYVQGVLLLLTCMFKNDAHDCRTLADVLPEVLRTFCPELVLYDGGIDVHKHDALGRLSLSDEGLMRREMQVGHRTCVRLHFQCKALTIAYLPMCLHAGSHNACTLGCLLARVR